ncbi:transposase domain-containing protein [Bradyrhizobium sp. 164]|nr:transposase domain-containing protein [Bradyrhizobium sp. 164]
MRRNWTFAGSDEGSRRAAAIYSLLATAKLNDIDPQAWLADVWRAYRITPPSALTNCCLGIGSLEASSRCLSAINRPPKTTQLGAVAGCVHLR